MLELIVRTQMKTLYQKERPFAQFIPFAVARWVFSVLMDFTGRYTVFYFL